MLKVKKNNSTHSGFVCGGGENVNKKILIIALALFALPLVTIMPVSAKGPTNAGGIKPVEAWGFPFAPYNDNAFWHSGQYIGPSIFGVGTETVIVEDGVTITVSAIPDAILQDGEYVGTWLMWKANYNSKTYMMTYKFLLNGAGPVDITYDDGVNPPIVEQATEFIFFWTEYEAGVWNIKLQSYK